MVILDKDNSGTLDKEEVSDFITKMLGYEMETKSTNLLTTGNFNIERNFLKELLARKGD